jgi:hypothetical protein
MKKNVLREYLKNREEKTLTLRQDRYFTFEVDDVDLTNSDNDTFGKIIKKAAKEAVEIYEEKVVKPKKKAKKGDK